MAITLTTPPRRLNSTNGAISTTSGAIALGNLQAQIDGLDREATAGRLNVAARVSLVEMIALRGHLLGRIVDYERAHTMAEQLAQDAPSDGATLLARALTRARFHRFIDALTDLDEAESSGADHDRVAAERASIFQAIGRHDEALAIYRDAVEQRADFHALGDLATLYADCGEISAAESAFTASRSRYCGVSPIPLAQLDFRRAHMWTAQGELPRARTWLEEAVSRFPAYAPAQGHLAEVEAALGEPDAAITRLSPLTSSSDDPVYAGQLARILDAAGRPDGAGMWRARAARRYEDLVARHLEAFADHAAEFWLDAGADPQRAFWLATINVEIRPTGRAHHLMRRASDAHRSGADLPRRTSHVTSPLLEGQNDAGFH